MKEVQALTIPFVRCVTQKRARSSGSPNVASTSQASHLLLTTSTCASKSDEVHEAADLCCGLSLTACANSTEDEASRRALAYHAVQSVAGTKSTPAARVAIPSDRCASCGLALFYIHVHLYDRAHPFIERGGSGYSKISVGCHQSHVLVTCHVCGLVLHAESGTAAWGAKAWVLVAPLLLAAPVSDIDLRAHTHTLKGI